MTPTRNLLILPFVGWLMAFFFLWAWVFDAVLCAMFG